MPKDSGVYDDDLTDEERKLLDEHMKDDDLPPEDDSDDNSADLERVQLEQGQHPSQKKDEPAKEGEGGEPGEKQPAAEPSEEERFAAFMKANEGKSAEDFAKLAFQRSAQANRAAYDGRKVQERLDALVGKAKSTLDAKKAEIAAKRDAFGKQMEEDPDAATRRLHEEQLGKEEQRAQAEAEAAEHDARVEAALAMASAAIPDFVRVAPQLQAFATDMGFSKAELDSIDDGRHLILLHLARIAATQMKAGIINNAGMFIGMPKAVEQGDDPRLKQPDPLKTLNGQRGASAKGAGTVDDRVRSALDLSDEDFDKLDPKELEAMLRETS